MANTRLRRCAQVIARCRSVADSSSPGCLVAAAVRVPGTIRARSGLAGANTPWYRVRWARGFGTSAASRAIKSSGSTKSPGAILDSRRLARRAQGRMPGATSRAWCRRDTVSSAHSVRARPGSATSARWRPAVLRRSAPGVRSCHACEAFAAMPACSEKPELSATSGRGASGSAGSVCSVNTFWPSLGPVAIR